MLLRCLASIEVCPYASVGLIHDLVNGKQCWVVVALRTSTAKSSLASKKHNISNGLMTKHQSISIGLFDGIINYLLDIRSTSSEASFLSKVLVLTFAFAQPSLLP